MALYVSVTDSQEVRAPLNWYEAHHISPEGALLNLSDHIHDVTLPSSNDGHSLGAKFEIGAVVTNASLEISDPQLPLFGLKPQYVAFSERADTR